MAFVRANFERIGGGLKKLFLYNATADTVATATGSGYFNGIQDEVDAGDVIMIVANNNASIDNAIVTSARGVTPVTTTAVEGVTAT